MTTQRLTAIEMVLLVITTVVLLLALFSFNVQALELASQSNSATMQHAKNDKNPGNVTAASDNETRTKADILKERGVPGKGIENAPGLQKPFNPKSAADDHAGGVSDNRTRGNSDNRTSLSPLSENRTRTKAEILQERGVPGKGIENAPGLQKPFNPNARTENWLQRWQQRFQEMWQKYFGNNRGKD